MNKLYFFVTMYIAHSCGRFTFFINPNAIVDDVYNMAWILAITTGLFIYLLFEVEKEENG